MHYTSQSIHRKNKNDKTQSTDLHDNIRLLPDILRLHDFGTNRFIIRIREVRWYTSTFFNNDVEAWSD